MPYEYTYKVIVFITIEKMLLMETINIKRVTYFMLDKLY